MVAPRIRFPVRIPADLLDMLRAAALESGRSVNAEIVHRLRLTFTGWRR